MTKSTFRFSTDILRRLGEELNPTPDHGILELVKNSYDADAIKCTISLAEEEKGIQTIQVVDDGVGMTENEIRDGWLVLGRSGKSLDTLSALGRRPSGNKGLGRLAALRLGKGVLLVTRPRGSDKEYRLDIDWKRFDGSKVVEEIPLEIETTARKPKAKDGTEITIRGATGFDRFATTRLARELLLLADPFSDNPSGFQPSLVAPEFADLEKLVKQRYFDAAEYHLTATVNEKGHASAVAKDWRGKALFKANHEDLRVKRADEAYRSPPATFDIWVFKLDAETFSSRKHTLGEVRDWLKVVGGVHLYLRGLRVLPYGEPGHDWLDMNLRRSRSPEERPSTNTTVGRVMLDDRADVLKQKTDRSGLIEGPEYVGLRTFAQEALDWLARERLKLRESKRRKERVEAKADVETKRTKLASTIKNLPAKQRKVVEDRLKQYEKAHERDVSALRQEVQLYRTLGTAGIAAETFAHESTHPIKLIRDNAGLVEKSGRKALKEDYEKLLKTPVERIHRAATSLDAFTGFTLNFVSRDKRRSGRVDVHAVIGRLKDALTPLLDDRRMKMDLDFDERAPSLLGSEAAVESIIANLVLNAVKAVEKSGKERRILIRTRREGERLDLRVMDSGPGIRDIAVDDIWLPGQTTSPDGTGLGLTIVRDTVSDLGGTATAIANGELGGAEIYIELPILGW